MSKGPGVAAKRTIYARDGGRCAYCSMPIAADEATYDHRVPHSKGGTACQENIVLCCRLCNMAKRDLSEQTWRSLPITTRNRLREKARSGAERMRMQQIRGGNCGQ